MPELPSVERGRRLLEDYLVNKKIIDVNANESGGGPRDGLFDDIVFKNAKDGILPKDIVKTLKGKIVTASKRKGKYLWISLKDDNTTTTTNNNNNNNQQPKRKKRKVVMKNKKKQVTTTTTTKESNDVCFHFGMTGNVKVKFNNELVKQKEYAREKKNNGDHDHVWPPKYSKMTMKFDDDTEFAFTTSRRIARISFHTNIEKEEPISKLGFDPLTSMLPLNKFKKDILTLSGNIKKNLLDQSYICGIGNWICDDVLFASGIHPSKECKHLRDDEVKSLHKAIKDIINKACKMNGNKDKFPKKWLFHYRWSKKKEGIKHPIYKKTIKFIKVAGRTTAMIPDMQKIGKKRS